MLVQARILSAPMALPLSRTIIRFCWDEHNLDAPEIPCPVTTVLAASVVLSLLGRGKYKRGDLAGDCERVSAGMNQCIPGKGIEKECQLGLNEYISSRFIDEWDSTLPLTWSKKQ